ncbi:hypothetical protein [Ilumatobacter coccineus]|jgi:hypothetical protein|uniref:Uncharacterized protein n=1 Tax=Ilumatobacter coccineus (strain NBRC 103263 / KCTC 29153 / YM16-304) TaxID=1313172 RepID=A0A6C7EBW1_ILUCY|nr:hypothetical protein [Ilumatobacter coccineus]BAN02128.1 hypothetical protein YM304_18140 [Ilumatobacter coccineus YM16-304]
MIAAYWNALRVGTEVHVHDDDDRGFALSTGTVSSIESRPGSNSVTVRLSAADGTTRLVRPKRLAVHLGARDLHDECWRCGLRQ